MKHLGDITKIHGNAVEIVDVVTGGSPCQDLSVAGKRAGLAGERSGLFMEQIRIIKEMRDECRKRLYDAGADYNRTDVKPRYMVWENVAGAFSSNKGEDFRAVLEETAKVADKDAYVPGLEGGARWSPCGCILGNGWSIAWRLHDAQYWGVPQRRKRICLLADFNGDTAGKVLFELQRETTNRDTEQAIVDIRTESRSEVQSVSKGLSGDIAQGGKEGERVTEDTERCANPSSYTLKIRGGADTYRKPDGSIGTAGKGALVQTELSGTLGVSQDQTLIAFEPGAMSRVGGHAYEDVADTVRANAGDNKQAVVYGIGSYDSNAMKSDNPHSGIYKADTSRTLDLNGGNPGCNQGGMAVVCIEGNGQRESHKGDGYKESDTMYTLNTVEQHAIAYRGDAITSPINASNLKPGDPCHTLTDDSRNYVVLDAMAVESHAQDARYNVGEINQPLSANMEHDPANGGLVMAIENHPADSRVKIAEDGICQTLSGRMGTGGGNVPMVMEPTCLTRRFSSVNVYEDGITPTLEAGAGEGGNNMPMVMRPQTFSDIASCLSAADGTKGVHSQMMKNPEQNFILETSDGEIAGTLDASYYKGCGERQGIERTVVAMTTEMTPKIDEKNKDFSLRSRDYKDPQCVAYGLDRASYNQRQNAQYNFSVDEEKVGTCVAKGPNAVCKAVDCLNGRGKDVNGTLAANARKSLNSGNVVRCESVVRRLTPMECERLQGFPDNWTNIGDWVDSKGKTHKGESDSPRYKALGNSLGLPFWQWMAYRMVKYLPQNCTMASLFSGIGGFELVFSRAGCKPLWCSEIEEFGIAVTKKHFPDNE